MSMQNMMALLAKKGFLELYIKSTTKCQSVNCIEIIKPAMTMLNRLHWLRADNIAGSVQSVFRVKFSQ